VPLDGSEDSEQVLPLAMALAARMKSGIHLLNVVDIDQVPVLERPRDQDKYQPHLTEVLYRAERAAQTYLKGIEENIVAAGLTATSKVEVGSPADAIATEGTAADVDFTAMATHGRSGLPRWILGSTADKVLRTAKTPLLLFHPDHKRYSGDNAISSILLPLDGSPEAEKAIPLATRLARTLSVPIKVARVVPVITYAYGPESYSAGEILTEMTEEAEAYVAEVAGRLQKNGLNCTVETRIGDPAMQLLQWAKAEGGGLMVMSTHARTGVNRAILGSVTEKVVRGDTFPVLVISPQAVAQATSEIEAAAAGR
jgi:nucleotide-binding universal stress UspA family protein